MPTGSKTVCNEIRTGGRRRRPYLRSTYANEDAVRSGVQRIAVERGRIDICANIAGIINWQPLLDSDIEDFDRHPRDQPARNIHHVAGMAAAFHARRRTGRGASLRRHPCWTARSCQASCLLRVEVGSSLGLDALASRRSLDGKTFTVNCIAPGYFLTEINATLQSRPGYTEAINGVTPMERWGDPKEIVGGMDLPCVRGIELRHRSGATH